MANQELPEKDMDGGYFHEPDPGPDYDTRDQEGEGSAPGMTVTYVNAYAVDRNYGGPEEGGW